MLRATLSWKTAASIAAMMMMMGDCIATSDALYNKTVNLRHLAPRVVGGGEVPKGSYPSFAFTGNGCGSTLLAHDLLLTAAHCYSYFSGNAKVGGVNFDGSDSEEIPVKKEIPHPKFEMYTFKNDIMVVKLGCSSRGPPQKLGFNHSIATGAPMVAIGFGHEEENSGDMSEHLREVQVIRISNAVCSSQYQGTYTIFNDMICAGVRRGGKDTCQGDSGGPLLTVDGSQVGITSFGIGCARKDKPGVYTKLTSYESWIKEMIKTHSAKTPKYCDKK